MTINLLCDSCGDALSGRLTDEGIKVDICHCVKPKNELIMQLYGELPSSIQCCYRGDVERVTKELVS